MKLMQETMARRKRQYEPPMEPWEINSSIPARFRRIAGRHPQRRAIVSAGETATYQDLDRASDGVARALLAAGNKEPEVIVLLQQQRLSLFESVLGVLKAGKICLPIHPDLPLARQQQLFDQGGGKIILTTADLRERALALSSAARFVYDMGEVNKYTQDVEQVAIDPKQTAVLLTTSGSTGRPKLVMRAHGATLHNVWNNGHGLYLEADDRYGLTAFLGYGAGCSNTFNTLLAGATLVNLQVAGRTAAEIIQQMRDLEVSKSGISAPLLRQILAAVKGPEQLPHLRLLRSRGQTLQVSVVNEFRRKLGGHCLLLNGLASSELGGVAYGVIDEEMDLASGNVPVGFPAAGKEVLILDDQGEPVAADTMGQIAVRSRHISPGYWRDPELTAAYFLPDPAGSDKRVFLTGDLGRLRGDGLLEHHGRLAHSHKIRGSKVNLAEVERSLANLPLVDMACVRVMPDAYGDNELVAYIVAPENEQATVTTLRGGLAASIPESMIPTQFVFLDSLPLLPNGKVDAAALPAPDGARPPLAVAYKPPSSTVEQAIVAIWCDVLKLETVGVEDNFFDLGGQSLLAATVIARLNDQLEADLTVASLFTAPTVAGLAALLEEEGEQREAIDDRELDAKLRLLGF